MQPDGQSALRERSPGVTATAGGRQSRGATAPQRTMPDGGLSCEVEATPSLRFALWLVQHRHRTAGGSVLPIPCGPTTESVQGSHSSACHCVQCPASSSIIIAVKAEPLQEPGRRRYREEPVRGGSGRYAGRDRERDRDLRDYGRDLPREPARPRGRYPDHGDDRPHPRARSDPLSPAGSCASRLHLRARRRWTPGFAHAGCALFALSGSSVC